MPLMISPASVKQYGNDGVALRLRDASEALSTGRLPIIVCGEFKRGKSSLINALLDVHELCPVDVAIATNVVSVITYGPALRISISLAQDDEPGTSTSTVVIDPSELRNYVTEQGNPDNAKRVQLVTIELPHEKLRTGWVFIDTPGVGGINADHAAATYAFLPNAAGALFVADVVEPLAPLLGSDGSELTAAELV